MTILQRAGFVMLAKGFDPAAAAEFDRQHGQLHAEMTVFRRAVQRAVQDRDQARTRSGFRLALLFWQQGDPQLRAAAEAEFVAALDFGAEQGWAWLELPPALQALYVARHGAAPASAARHD